MSKTQHATLCPHCTFPHTVQKVYGPAWALLDLSCTKRKLSSLFVCVQYLQQKIPPWCCHWISWTDATLQYEGISYSFWPAALARAVRAGSTKQALGGQLLESLNKLHHKLSALQDSKALWIRLQTSSYLPLLKKYTLWFKLKDVQGS